MGDLSDDELMAMQSSGAPYIDRDQRVARAIAEIRRHRAAQAADAERVRAVVGAELRDWLPADALTDSEIGRIADGVAAQLAAPPPGHVCPVSYGLGPEDVEALEWLSGLVSGGGAILSAEQTALGKILAAHRAPTPTIEPLPEVIACGTDGCVSSIKKHLLPAGWLLLDGTWRCPRCKVIATSETS